METSIVLARIFSVVYLSVGIGMLLNQSYFKKGVAKMLDDFTAVLLGGMMALIMGMLILTYHNTWNADWTSLITFIGWMGLLKGVLLFVAPEWLLGVSKSMTKSLFTLSMSLAVVLGLILGYFGFIA